MLFSFSESDSEESNAESWSLIPECQAVRITECDLSSAITDYFQLYNVSLRADTGEEHSSWAYLVFSPYTEGMNVCLVYSSYALCSC